MSAYSSHTFYRFQIHGRSFRTYGRIGDEIEVTLESSWEFLGFDVRLTRDGDRWKLDDGDREYIRRHFSSELANDLENYLWENPPPAVSSLDAPQKA